MITEEEKRLKDIFISLRSLKAEAEELTTKLVFPGVLCFSKIPRNYDEILKILKDFLKKNNSEWVNIMFYAECPVDGYNIHPHVNIKIFLFGRRRFILRNIKEIVEE